MASYVASCVDTMRAPAFLVASSVAQSVLSFPPTMPVLKRIKPRDGDLPPEGVYVPRREPSEEHGWQPGSDTEPPGVRVAPGNEMGIALIALVALGFVITIARGLWDFAASLFG